MVLPIMGVMTSDAGLADEVMASLEHELGSLILSSPPVPFTVTRYYEPEMGPGLMRFYAAFGRLMPANKLVELKHRTAEIEAGRSMSGRRAINMDPGYLDLHKVVLASFKEGNYKIYLDRGVWADPVLGYADGAFHTQPWSFPDLSSGAHMTFFFEARTAYKSLRKAWLDSSA